MSRTFVSVRDVVLVCAIERAEKRLVFITPGLWPPVANALTRAMDIVPHAANRLGRDTENEDK